MNNELWDDAIFKIADKLMKKPAEFTPEQIYPCSVCGSQLIIQVGHYQRGKINMIGITIECKICNHAIAVDGIEG